MKGIIALSGPVHCTGPRRLLLLAAMLLLLASCARPPELLVLGGSTMGTQWTVRTGVPPTGLTRADMQADIEALLLQVNAEMSTYIEDSDISRYNRAASGESFTLPEGFSRVLQQALALASDTDGAFDPTVGPLVNLWGFGPDLSSFAVPPDDELDAARARVGWEQLAFDPVTRQLEQPGGVYLDLSAIAKGYAVDLIAERLLERGVQNFLVDIGGDLRTAGTRPDGQPWRVGIERPDVQGRQAHLVIEASNIAMATSGSYRNYFESGGRRYSHTIDPRSGHPVQHRSVSITVLAETCMEADGLATALGVMPPEDAYRFALERQVAVFWLLEDEGEIKEMQTPAFTALTFHGVH